MGWEILHRDASNILGKVVLQPQAENNYDTQAIYKLLEKPSVGQARIVAMARRKPPDEKGEEGLKAGLKPRTLCLRRSRA
jgi:hypothetical protein